MAYNKKIKRIAQPAHKVGKRESGFTLIELLVVIGIIAILATIGAINFGSARSKARDAKRIADLKQIQSAIEVIAAGSAPGLYPTSGTLTTEITSVTPPQTADAYCYYYDTARTSYILAAEAIENLDNSQNGDNTDVDTSSGWTLITISGSATACPAVAATNAPDCDDSGTRTYCLKGSTQT